MLARKYVVTSTDRSGCTSEFGVYAYSAEDAVFQIYGRDPEGIFVKVRPADIDGPAYYNGVHASRFLSPVEAAAEWHAVMDALEKQHD